MPDGIYLDALELGPTKLAKEMNNIINVRHSYYDMFKWHNYYSYYDPLAFPETSGICELCALLNNEQQDKRKMHNNIVKWFNDRKDWNFDQENKSLARKLTMYAKNVIKINKTLLPRRKEPKEKNKSVIIPYSDNKTSQEDENIVIYDDIAATASGNYKTGIEYNSYVFNSNNSEEKSINIKNKNNNNREIVFIPSTHERKRHQNRRHKKRRAKTKTEDTSIRCPNLGTCFQTIISNMKGKVISLFSLR